MVRKPKLGTHLKTLFIDLNITRGWDSTIHSGVKVMRKWKTHDVDRAWDAIKEICRRDIWKGYSMKGFGGHWEGRVGVDEASQAWLAELLDGKYSAVLPCC